MQLPKATTRSDPYVISLQSHPERSLFTSQGRCAQPSSLNLNEPRMQVSTSLPQVWTAGCLLPYSLLPTLHFVSKPLCLPTAVPTRNATHPPCPSTSGCLRTHVCWQVPPQWPGWLPIQAICLMDSRGDKSSLSLLCPHWAGRKHCDQSTLPEVPLFATLC
jgi:hypothetical protein